MNKMLVLKLLAIAALTVVILIALFMVSGIITDRERFRDEAISSIEESYAGAQTWVGPVLVQPYTEPETSTELGPDGKTKVNVVMKEVSDVTFPAKMAFAGTLDPSERRHGLYRAAVYGMQAHVTASIDVPDQPSTSGRNFGEPYLAFELSDVRGIIGLPVVRVNGQPMTMTQGGVVSGAIEQLATEPASHSSFPGILATPLRAVAGGSGGGWQPNLRVRLPNAQRGHTAHYDVDVTMQIAGTQRLSVAPIADLNDVMLQSSWPAPLFAGRFLPRAPEVGSKGFLATWSLSSLAAATQQQIITGGNDIDTLNVSLLTPIDPYKLSDRATKYGILFVLLTFGGFFIFEVMKQMPIHPVQYMLVGFGLAVFFLLLISFSEHMRFGLAYLLASAACIGLLTFYLCFVLKTLGRGLAFGAMLALLYAAVYGLLISEDNALVLGSVLLFVVLAVVMFVTRKVDWYSGSDELAKVKGYVPPSAPPPLVSP